MYGRQAGRWAGGEAGTNVLYLCRWIRYGFEPLTTQESWSGKHEYMKEKRPWALVWYLSGQGSELAQV